MDIDFLSEGPAIIIEGERRLFVACDLHMGIESDLRSYGFHFKSHGNERITRLTDLLKDTSPDLILLLGDIKHRVPGTSFQEYRELPFLFESIRKLGELIVTPGNHDPGIEAFLKPVELLPIDGGLIDGYGFMHGHTKPAPEMAGHLIFAGHHHPMITLSDEVGPAIREPCYILGELKDTLFADTDDEESKSTRVLLLPSFNEIAGYGIEHIFRKPFSPISKALIIDTAECLTPDGSYAGDLFSIVQTGKRRRSDAT